MLVLTRKVGEEIVIGEGITVSIVAIHGNRVRIGIDAPLGVTIRRAELPAREPAEPAFAGTAVELP